MRAYLDIIQDAQIRTFKANTSMNGMIESIFRVILAPIITMSNQFNLCKIMRLMCLAL